MVPYLIKKGEIPMFKKLKDSFNYGDIGINVSCSFCKKTNFVSSAAMSAKPACRHCRKELELSGQSKDYLLAMSALLSKMG